MLRSTINVGIVAHVDAGKTTITESFLFLSGAIRDKGSVDKGTTQTDNMSVERERGISVKATLTSLNWNDTKINLIDTPGHADFASEVERTFSAMDAAVLVINAADGVQGQTTVLWEALRQNKIPTIIFLNKIDRAGVDTGFCIDEIRKELAVRLVILQKTQNEGSENVIVFPDNHPFVPEFTEEIIETLAEADDELFERYLADDIPSEEELYLIMKRLVAQVTVVPVLLGSAKNSMGVGSLLDGITSLFEASKGSDESAISGIVFKIQHDKTLGRLAGVRLFDGKLKVKDEVRLSNSQSLFKINQIKLPSQGNLLDVKEMGAGDVAWISGWSSVKVGDFIGELPVSFRPSHIGRPLLHSRVVPVNEQDLAQLASALEILATEDPALELLWFREENELLLKIMGWVQIDILKYVLRDRFGLEADFEQPTVIYKETPSSEGMGEERYTMPKPCWAVVHFKIEPGERGSGVQYQSLVSVDKIHQKYQNEIERTIYGALAQGIKGWEVTDLKITLIDGQDHEIHSRPGDFVLATPVGLMKGLENCGTTLLEPILAFNITAPEEMLGQIVSDITQMRGTFESPVILEDRFEMKGTLPLASSMDYPVKLSSRSAGKARITTHFLEYQACSDQEGQIREFKGVCPLDRSKWILKMRGAYHE
ncbi:MAG: TetM/TetW/TetO/TetS family tetracycline resistance ribosomal protection protein [Bacteroidales bacterium]|nr:TetM/TetW/TetO/TetS family tetracycline resistance ribosomal protection protein [Bacteroidales bacterium]